MKKIAASIPVFLSANAVLCALVVERQEDAFFHPFGEVWIARRPANRSQFRVADALVAVAAFPY
jgi:hypothetical protein